MRILVVGASGFLGQQLFHELSMREHNLVGTSRTKSNFMNLDITDHATCQVVLEKGHFDAVLNLAAVGVTAGTANEEEMMQVNSEGTLNFARTLSSLKNPPFLIHVSSSTEPIGAEKPESVYSKSKARGTTAVVSALTQAHIPFNVVRIHNTYGPTQPNGRFIISLVKKMRDRETFQLNYPNRVRDFCLIDDVTGHLADLVEQQHSSIAIREIGTGKGTTLLNVAHLICQIVGAPKSLITTQDSRIKDPSPVQVADTTSPDFLQCKTSLQDGLDLVVRSFL